MGFLFAAYTERYDEKSTLYYFWTLIVVGIILFVGVAGTAAVVMSSPDPYVVGEINGRRAFQNGDAEKAVYWSGRVYYKERLRMLDRPRPCKVRTANALINYAQALEFSGDYSAALYSYNAPLVASTTAFDVARIAYKTEKYEDAFCGYCNAITNEGSQGLSIWLQRLIDRRIMLERQYIQILSSFKTRLEFFSFMNAEYAKLGAPSEYAEVMALLNDVAQDEDGSQTITDKAQTPNLSDEEPK